MRRRSRRPSREQLAAQSADVERLAAGGIPAAAERRLRSLAERPGAFTSDLSVAEFGLLRDARLEPLTQVAGSCVFYVGWQYVGAGWTRPQELTSLATAHTDARRRAVARLRREA